MEKIVLLLISLSLVLIIFHYSVKVAGIIALYRKGKFKDSKAEFNYDLYRLQQKWIKRGEQEYTKGIGMIIDAFNQAEEEQPETDYGKTVIERLRKALD